MYLVAVKPEYQERGVIAIIMNALNKSAIEAGVKYSETNVELETNVKVQACGKTTKRSSTKAQESLYKGVLGNGGLVYVRRIYSCRSTSCTRIDYVHDFRDRSGLRAPDRIFCMAVSWL